MTEFKTLDELCWQCIDNRACSAHIHDDLERTINSAIVKDRKQPIHFPSNFYHLADFDEKSDVYKAFDKIQKSTGHIVSYEIDGAWCPRVALTKKPIVDLERKSELQKVPHQQQQLPRYYVISTETCNREPPLIQFVTSDKSEAETFLHTIGCEYLDDDDDTLQPGQEVKIPHDESVQVADGEEILTLTLSHSNLAKAIAMGHLQYQWFKRSDVSALAAAVRVCCAHGPNMGAVWKTIRAAIC